MNYRTWLLITIALFITSAVFGWLMPEDVAQILAGDIAALEELGSMLVSLPPALTAIIILAKNTLSLLISFIMSPILCLVPLLALIANGWLLGWISATVLETEPLSFLLAGLLPHGIIELPAFFIGEAAALSSGSLIIMSLFNRESRTTLLPKLKQNLKYFVLALALLLPAALIETFITPLLIK